MFVVVVLILCSLLPVCRAQLHASFFTSAHSCDDLADEVGQLAEAGRLSLARANAAKIVAGHPDCEKNVARRYVEAADIVLASWQLERTGSEEACMDNSHVAEPFTVLHVEPQRHLDSLKPYEHEPCWYGNGDLSSAAERWDLCCSGLTDHNNSPARGSRSSAKSNVTCQDEISGLMFCCDFFDGSASHLRLPALREVALKMRVNITGDVDTKTCTNSASCTSDSTQSSHGTRIIALEQDGFLRPFDVSSILWPAGYLLTLCVASPEHYGVDEIRQAIDAAIAKGRRDFFAIELGTGIGASSVALSLYLQHILKEETEETLDTARNRALVMATDTAKHALALAKANAKRNNAQIGLSRLDYNNRTGLERIAKTYGKFQLVIGSSLQAFFDGTNDPKAPVWAALDILLDRSNPKAIAIFSHTRSEPIEQPSDFRFRLLRRISGDNFNMKTRSGESSDFELSLFCRT